MTKEQYDRNLTLVAALRSGKYEQARGYLRQGNSFCCLGVACDLVPEGIWEGASDGVHAFRGQNMLLPVQIMDWYGLLDTAGPLLTTQLLSAAALNDSGGTFSFIADAWEDWLMETQEQEAS